MNILFSNPPWWGEKESGYIEKTIPLINKKAKIKVKRYRQGVRAGSRWPFTLLGKAKPDKFSSLFKDYIPYPFFMGYAATYLKTHTGYDVKFRDSIALKESYTSYFTYITQHAFDYIFIESATPSFEHDKKIIAEIQNRSPRSKIVLTGPISIKGQELIDELSIHAVIKGEYEKGSLRVINGESEVIDFDLLTPEEMNEAPLPYFDEDIAYKYWDALPKGQKFPQAQIWASRGCPFKCIFCVWPATMTGDDPDGTKTRTVRYYTPDYVRGLLTYLTQNFTFRSIYFDDDTFNLGDRHTREICEVMKEFNLPWSAMCRIDTIKEKTWKLMKESGCFGVKLGFESGCQYVVDNIVNKHLDLKKARETIHYLKSLNIKIHGTFTFGLPGETKEQMLQTLKFTEEIGCDSVQYSGTAEIEGTPLATLRKTGKLEHFQGASIDENYNREVDGSQKWQRLVQELANDH